MTITNGSNSFVATDKPKINAYINREINKAIDVEMAKEWRSKSQMIELLLKEALEGRGYTFDFDSIEKQQEGKS